MKSEFNIPVAPWPVQEGWDEARPVREPSKETQVKMASWNQGGRVTIEREGWVW